MSAAPRCGCPSRVRPRLVAAAPLGLLLVRLLWGESRGWSAVPEAAALLLLGACLWWVAHRQAGLPGASAALGLFVSAPIAGDSGLAAFSAVGLFGMVYTGVGVAHALQGPRRKWPPRIMLMAALTAFTAACSPTACAAGLVLAALAMLYLAEGRRRLLPGLFAVWVAVAVLVITLVRGLSGAQWAGAWWMLSSGQSAPLLLWRRAGLAVAVAAALALWIGSRRARYFGNSAPLLASLLLAALSVFAGPVCLIWMLPFALLFGSGCFADAFETRSGHIWAAGCILVCAWQFFATF